MDINQQEDVNKIFKKLKGQVIKKFSVIENADQHFHIITNKIDLKFGANDLGVWIEKYKKTGIEIPLKNKNRKNNF